MSPAALRVIAPTEASEVYDPDLAREVEEWLHGLDDRYLLCRGQHAFPKLYPRNGKLPKGVSASPIPHRPGHMQIRQVCRDCGLPRTYTAFGDIFARRKHYSYDYDALPGYRMPKGGLSYLIVERDGEPVNLLVAERERRAAEALREIPGMAEMMDEAAKLAAEQMAEVEG